MKIAFTHNLKLTEAEEEAEFDTVETVDAIAAALNAGGHEVEKIEVSGPASHLAARIEAYAPDLIFNTAEGRRGRAREAFYPALFEELNYPYTGSDAYVLTVTLDKWLTKCVVREAGVDTPRARLVTARDLAHIEKIEGSLGVAIPAIVKPNYEGSSKGIGDDSVGRDWRSVRGLLDKMIKQYPAGVLIEEFIPGVDVTVPFVEGLGDEGILSPVEYVIESGARSKFNIYDYRLKNTDPGKVGVRCPPELPRDVLARVRTISKTAVRALGMRDVGRIDFRLGDDGRIYFLEVNALPSLEPGASIFAASKREGLSYEQTIAQVVKSAGVRWGLHPADVAPRKKQSDRLRIGFCYNMKRVESKSGNDAEAEYDPPETIDAIRTAIESLGYEVVPLEATSELPQRLADAKVDLVFNIAEGLVGRNREAQVPALCELIGLPYTGSDSATLALALDKALAKRILRQHGILTPEFQVFTSGREKLHPWLAQKFPLIVKPNAEGSSKGITGSGVVDDEPALRVAVLAIVEKYRQPALVEEYISGREFTVGLLGDKRPRILPPMEICFKDRSKSRPVYDFEIKQEWEKHVFYECPAKLTTTELRIVERTARETFIALDCRDVARIDLRMSKDGQVYVLEINPLPGLTPDYSDLVLIAKAAGIDYRTLIGEILTGALKRLREKRREPRSGLDKDRDRERDRTDKVEKIDPPTKPEVAT
jgi:D-alanine--D-alanine ligase